MMIRPNLVRIKDFYIFETHKEKFIKGQLAGDLLLQTKIISPPSKHLFIVTVILYIVIPHHVPYMVSITVYLHIY